MQEDGWQTFLHLCAKLKTPQQFQEFFDLYLTLEEKEALAARALIIQALLDERLTQREIADQLGVSISKITRGSNALKITSPGLKEFIKKYG